MPGRARWAVICILATAPASADPGDIDFAGVFADNADAVIALGERDGVIRDAVDLPGAVRVVRLAEQGSVRYVGIDNSGHAAMGCVWLVYQELLSHAQNCPAAFDPADRATLDWSGRQIARFVAQNTVPPVPFERFWSHWTAVFAATPSQCGGADGAELTGIAEALTQPEALVALDASLAAPRLPVATPCF